MFACMCEAIFGTSWIGPITAAQQVRVLARPPPPQGESDQTWPELGRNCFGRDQKLAADPAESGPNLPESGQDSAKHWAELDCG